MICLTGDVHHDGLRTNEQLFLMPRKIFSSSKARALYSSFLRLSVWRFNLSPLVWLTTPGYIEIVSLLFETRRRGKVARLACLAEAGRR